MDWCHKARSCNMATIVRCSCSASEVDSSLSDVVCWWIGRLL